MGVIGVGVIASSSIGRGSDSNDRATWGAHTSLGQNKRNSRYASVDIWTPLVNESGRCGVVLPSV